MPSESDIKKAKPVVDSLIADDVYVMNKKMKPPAAVASKFRSLAEKADTEAGKFLLLQSIFSVYASNGMYDEAGDALENLNSEITDVPPEEIVKMVDGAMSRVEPEKAPKVLSIYRAAQRKVKCRRGLESAKAEFKKRPNDKALIRTIGDCYVGMGDWPRALKAYARLGIAAAKYEMSPATTLNCDARWDYKAADDEPFKVHAAELYSAAVEKGLATGLRREMALKRIEDSKKLGVLRAQTREASRDQARQLASDGIKHGGGAKETKSTALNVKFKTGLVGYWPFDGDANDASGARNSGKPMGVVPTEDRFGESQKAYRFNGSSYVEVPDTLSLRNITGAVTMMAWINPRGWYDSWMAIMQKGDKRAVQYQLEISRRSVFQGREFKGQIDLEMDKWQHIALTYNGSQTVFYRNGQIIHTWRSSGRLAQNPCSLFIGYDPYGSDEYFVGAMDDVRLYNRALSEKEIQELYKAEAPEN